MSPSKESIQIGWKRVGQVFRYLEALDQHRNPVKRQLEAQPWHLWFRDLPKHASIRVGIVASNNSEQKGALDLNDSPSTDFLLKVARPTLTPCPAPPSALEQWLERGWDEPSNNVRIIKTQEENDEDGQTEKVHFNDNVNRSQSLERWQALREEWAANERPAREAMSVFSKLYEIRGQIAREGEKIELIIGTES